MKALRFLLTAVTVFLFFACGEEYHYQDSVPEVTPVIYVQGKGALNEVEADSGETLYLHYNLFVHDRQIPKEAFSQFISHFFWVFEDQIYNGSPLPLTFSELGIYNVFLNTVDYFGDTLQKKLTVYAGAPVSIQASSLSEFINPLDSSGVNLKWEISGVDSWEKARCLLYLSRDREKLWESFKDTVSCESPFHWVGSFANLIPETFHDTSYVFHWGVKTEIAGSEHFRDSASFFFRTRLIGNPNAILEIPVHYSPISPENIPKFRLSLLNAEGDTLQTLVSSENLVRFRDVSPAANLTISAKELLHPEYQAEEISVNALRGIYSVTDTLFFEDRILPERKPLYTEFSLGDSIAFITRDLGSGLNRDSTEVSMDKADIPFRQSGDTLYFENTCFRDSCKILVRLKDYSENESSPVYWEISRKGSFFVIGFPKISEKPK